MKARRGTLARAAAALGAACLLVSPLASPAGAQDDPISIYSSKGKGLGLGFTFGFTPSIFSPLLEPALLYASSTISSQGAGQAQTLAASMFPGSLAVGGAGCAGVPGPPWVQAYYPKTEGCPQRQEARYNRTEPSNFNPAVDEVLNQILERSSVTQGHLLASADLGRGLSFVEGQNLTLATDRNGEPVVTVESVEISSDAVADASRVGQRVTVTAKDVDLLGIVRISSIVSIAETSSDGVAGAADGQLKIGEVRVVDGDTTRRATLDADGLRVSDPDLSHDQRLGLQERVDEGLLAAGVELSVAQPVEIVDDTTAEASVGGVLLAIKGAAPPVAVPREAAQVLGAIIEQIPTRCLSEFGAPLPLCFGAGALPGPGSAVRLTFSIASASSSTVADSLTFDFGPPQIPPGPFVPPAGPGSVPVPGPIPTGAPAPAPTAPPAAPPTQASGPLVGLVAKLPAAALLWGGTGLLALALGLAFGPSLRHAGPR